MKWRKGFETRGWTSGGFGDNRTRSAKDLNNHYYYCLLVLEPIAPDYYRIDTKWWIKILTVSIWFLKVSTSIKEIYFKFLSIVSSQDDHDRVKVIETLSKKLEELFEEHFASWDFDNISGSPRESSPVLHRFKTAGQKPVTGRYGNTKKCQSSSITENI